VQRLAILILFALAAPVFAQPASGDESARVDGLITQLGDEDWATRERASRELVGIGEPARKALRVALENDDPEVRVRASGALISIGEEFAYAVECAIADSERLREHGRAALKDLFRIDDPKILRELSPMELQPRGWTNSNVNIGAPPVVAIARLQALSGAGLLVSEGARESWQRILEQPMANISIDGSADQIAYARNALQRYLQSALGNKPASDQLVPRVLRIGRRNVFYITRVGDSAGVVRRCGEQLLSDLLGEGEASVRAALLLAESAGTDADAAARIREQYVKRPELTRLMWLALALEPDEDSVRKVRARDHADAVALLKSRDWAVLALVATYFEQLEGDARGAALSERIATSTDALELTVALWIARGAMLTPEARTRVGTLVSSKQDMLAASAARWFTGAAEISDAELDAVWQAGEFQPLASSFYTAALALVQRADVADRLVEKARAAFKSNFSAEVSRHALAAAVLTGRASEQDLDTALDKLTAAHRMARLVQQFAEMFNGCAALPEATIKKFVEKLLNSDANVRRVYMLALRKCDSALRVSVARAAVEKADIEVAANDKLKHVAFARLALLGVLAGAGDSDALDQIIKAVEGDDAELAKAGGAAYADAFPGDAVFKALEDLNNQPGLTHGPLAALEGYMEVCRRAAQVQDRVTFRKAYGIANGMQIINDNWQLRNELMQMQVLLGGQEKKTDDAPLPPDPILKDLTVG
jgi:hypothetical protein